MITNGSCVYLDCQFCDLISALCSQAFQLCRIFRFVPLLIIPRHEIRTRIKLVNNAESILFSLFTCWAHTINIVSGRASSWGVVEEMY